MGKKLENTALFISISSSLVFLLNLLHVIYSPRYDGLIAGLIFLFMLLGIVLGIAALLVKSESRKIAWIAILTPIIIFGSWIFIAFIAMALASP